jgi:hypothetical protein
MTQKQTCIACEGLIVRLKEAKAKNDVALAKIVYDQMREHRARVKYPAKHGWLNYTKV